MPIEVFVSNIDPNIEEARLVELFSEKADSVEAQVMINQKTLEHRDAARVKIESEIPDKEIIDYFNRLEFDGRQLYVSYYSPMLPAGKVTQEDRDAAQEISDTLHEADKQPRSQIQRIVQLCGVQFTRNLVNEALKIEEGGGMMIADMSRRRTLGGIFFYQARRRMSYRMQRGIFQYGKKKADQNKQQKGKGDQQPKGEKAPKSADKPASKKQQKPGAGEKTPKKKMPELPAVDPAELEDARRQLEQLREAFENARRHLEQLKTAPAAERKTGLFSATRQVANLQKQINELLRQFPHLNT